MQPWTTVKREIAFHHSKWLTVEDHTIRLPDGKTLTEWPWIITPDFINVIAITDQGRFLLFRQTKYAVQGVALAPVGGYLEPNEDPLLAARRELREETGYEAPDWTSLGSYAVDGNHGVATAHFYLARNARKVKEPESDDLEEQELLELTREEMLKEVSGRNFPVMSWMAAVSLALLETEKQKRS
jgi:ADP-ribose pyrophosphatase